MQEPHKEGVEGKGDIAEKGTLEKGKGTLLIYSELWIIWRSQRVLELL